MEAVAVVEVVKRFAFGDNLFKLRPRRISSYVAIKIFPVHYYRTNKLRRVISK